MKTSKKLKIEKFFKEQLGQYILVIAFICFCAWLFNKPFEAVMFCIGHTVVRKRFDKQFHCKTVGLCLITTLTIIWFAIMYILPINLSLLSAIPMSFIISYAGYIVQSKSDLSIELRKYKEKTIWTMNEEELSNYLTLKGIINDRAEFVKLILKGWTFGQIAEKLGYAECTLWDWSKICKNKLKIKSWDIDKN